jgi:hypothetical protein
MIALVWSFKNKLQDIPYRITHKPLVKTNGLRILNMRCNCPAFNFQGKGKSCKHLTALKEGVNNKTIEDDERFTLTDYGRQVLNLV